MIIPVRCFTCGKVIGNKWENYLGLLQAEYSEGDALDVLGLKRYCCRRMLLAHVDLIEKLLNYAPLEKWLYDDRDASVCHLRSMIDGFRTSKFDSKLDLSSPDITNCTFIWHCHRFDSSLSISFVSNSGKEWLYFGWHRLIPRLSGICETWDESSESGAPHSAIILHSFIHLLICTHRVQPNRHVLLRKKSYYSWDRDSSPFHPLPLCSSDFNQPRERFIKNVPAFSSPSSSSSHSPSRQLV